MNYNKKVVYTAFSKKLFYFRDHISKFVLQRNAIPINPFMVFDYFLLESVDKKTAQSANESLIRKADEVWVFGSLTKEMKEEIELAKKYKKPIQYFGFHDTKQIKQERKKTEKYKKRKRI